MKIEMRKVSDLIPYHNNPRINDGAVNHVASSIKEFGFKVPIVVDAFNVIVTGHTRLKAAQKLGLEEVPCIEADDLTPAQIKAFRLADNKTSEFSTWDADGNPSDDGGDDGGDDNNNNPGGGGGGGGTPSNGLTYVLTDTMFSNGHSYNLHENDSMKFKVNGTYHSLEAMEITESTVKVNISSDPQYATLSIGEPRRFELDGDSFYDLLATLISINSTDASDRIANITIKSISEEVTAETIAEEAAKEGVAEEEHEEDNEEEEEGEERWEEYYDYELDDDSVS